MSLLSLLFLYQTTTFVIPAKAGIHFDLKLASFARKWIPAFAGMTV
jgi:hypothetical protein